ncbi:DUF1295 domain-containing protein [Candidatus Synchoanobacter obligatus]|uniref:DUF1295 domain-containing protein n=1 Tax=Candidatus Synchoanobacter obligatus TaxID=2919597 RepID=A0ABT1L5L8_9GAMM|nr:DUF1295 domain-containing protein [Candidatus Synchoanobacter obligatus]MCP8352467.1 DUF1295 domain-containing protein [Candidatus Synchoanobacter obligatus]
MIEYAILFVWAWMSFFWIISTLIRNVSIVDTIYGLNFILIHVAYGLFAPNIDIISQILFATTSLWALRLSGYIGLKNYGIGEEKRYQRFREKYGKDRFWWFSYFQPFMIQGLFLLIFATPIHISYYQTIQFTHEIQYVLLALGCILFITGLIYESIADFQMYTFKKSHAHHEFLKTGLWQYSRHPNYFGEILLWFGMALIASSKALTAFSLIAFIGPMLLFYTLSELSGAKNHEPYLQQEKPGYLAHQANTPCIIPFRIK